MSTIFDIRSLALPKVPRRAMLVGALVVVLAHRRVRRGVQLYRKLTTTTVVAYFSEALALYPGDRVQIMGVRVGAIDKIEPAGDKMRITFHYSNKYQVPANATASILNPSLVASRTIQLSPPYTDGPVLKDGAVIPIERTQVPVEWDQLRESINGILRQLGPTPDQPKGPFGELVESAADNLAGKGKQINETLNSLSDALTRAERGPRRLRRRSREAWRNSSARYTGTINSSSRSTTTSPNSPTGSPNPTTTLPTRSRGSTMCSAAARNFLHDNGSVAGSRRRQPRRRDHRPAATRAAGRPGNRATRAAHLRRPTSTTSTTRRTARSEASIVFPNFANPMQFICSAIQAGSRLGYQDSAELCAQYLAPVLDAIKFNYLPFGANLFGSATTLPKEVAYSEERLRPPPGLQGHHRPGDLLAGHPVFIRQPRTGLGRRAGDAGHCRFSRLRPTC